MTATAARSAAVVSGAVLFTDLVGFTEFTAVEGDEGALELLALQEEVVTACLPAGSRVVKELGDGLLLWFPAPDAALLTALDLQDGFSAAARRTDLPLWVRMGLHWGEQRQRGTDLVGHDVNLAARIVDVAGPGEVLLSDTTLAALPRPVPGVSFDELGPVVMKGIPDPIALHRAWRP
jgi:adenylate cyclase